MTRHPAATPADAKAVWDSLKAPTVRAVADALTASGQFLPVSYGTIQRWKKRGWTGAAAAVPVLEQAAGKIDAAVPVLTGEAQTRIADLVTDPKAVALRGELQGLSDDLLIKTAAREAYITAIILLRQIQAKPALAEEKPREIGSLQQALAGSITAANGGFQALLDLQERLMKTLPEQPHATPTQDPLDAALDAWDQAEKEIAA